MKQVIVLQGVSGSGKTAWATKLVEAETERTDEYRACIVSADDYFVSLAGYKFDPSKLGEAHASCFKTFLACLQREACELVIVDNTNASGEDLSPYMLAASAFGANATIVRVDCDLAIAAKRCVHNVPTNAISRQAEKIRLSNETIARRGWKLQFVDGDK